MGCFGGVPYFRKPPLGNLSVEIYLLMYLNVTPGFQVSLPESND